MRIRILFFIFLSLISVGDLKSQDAVALVEASMRAHNPFGVPLNSIAATGRVTTTAGADEPIRIFTVGKDKLRIERGEDDSTTLMIANGEAGWKGRLDKIAPIESHAVVRRPTMFPFLDLLTEARNPRAQVTYHGTYALGPTTAHRFTIRVTDTAAEHRFLKAAIREEIDFYVDAVTLLVVRSERMQTAEDNIGVRIPMVSEFSDYRNISGVMVPFRVVNTLGTPATALYQTTLALSNVVLNPNNSDDLFIPTRRTR
jgi:hypothetical protein